MSGAANMPEFLPLQTIALFQTSKTQTLEASSQGTLDPESQGVIDLGHWPQSSEMLEGLEGFSHLWILFLFHRTHGQWKPKVLPPRAAHKVGVFASRSPYRPSPIGMSAVRLDSIEGSRLLVSGHDLIDQTPILDIKPYLPYADSFPEAKSGWVETVPVYEVSFSPRASEKLEFLRQLGVSEFSAALHQQLRFHPTDRKRKRVRAVSDQTDHFVFSYRTWRALFRLQAYQVEVLDILSGYPPEQLLSEDDPFQDKALHRLFLGQYG
jgi:tRNA-Thr(GGU) m(6)t(6)A37 methyltransferase TsaA